MNVPDYIPPIIGYRAWHRDAVGLKSLNGESWSPGKPLAAGCRVSTLGTLVGRPAAAHGAHDAPQADCTCGVYAAKSPEHLPKNGYDSYFVHGEVNLWGIVVEHELGWRAQFAYPKNLFLPLGMLPFTLAAVNLGLGMLAAYHADVFLADPKETVLLYARDSGYDAAGLDYLLERCHQQHIRCQQQRTLTKGARVAVLGRGIAIVQSLDEEHVFATLSGRSVLSIGRTEVVWDDRNMRWEAPPWVVSQGNRGQ